MRFPGASEGVKPRSKRKRGFHRAIKRNEPWALMQQAMNESCLRLSGLIYNATPDPNCRQNEIYGLAAWLPKD